MSKRIASSLILATALSVGIAATPVRADLQGEMNQFFDSLANTTDPTDHVDGAGAA